MFPRFHLFLQLGWLYCRSAVFNHQTFLLTLLACCILPVVGSSVICLAVFLQPAITSTLLCVYRRQPSLPHTPCSPVHLSPISSSAQHLHRPLPPTNLSTWLSAVCLGPWSKNDEHFQKLHFGNIDAETHSCFLIGLNKPEKEGRVVTSLMKDEEIAPENESTHIHTHFREVNWCFYWVGLMSKYGAIILFTCVERVYICKTPYKHTIEKKL